MKNWLPREKRRRKEEERRENLKRGQKKSLKNGK